MADYCDSYHFYFSFYNFQNILDSLLPGMLPLLATLLVWKLLNKKVKATYIIVILFVVGIIASLTGILAVAS